MKKILIFLFIMLFFVGCRRESKQSIIHNFSKKVKDSEGYLIAGKLKIYRGEDLYTYNVESHYTKEDNFKVSLENTTNNHKQIILKNNDGVYIVTPSLNKSFKFESEWPYNNSQIYLLQPIILDLEKDKDVKMEKQSNSFVLSFTSNYVNDKSLVKQKIFLNKNLNLKKVEVFNNEDELVMQFDINRIDMNYSCDEACYDLNSLINNNVSDIDKEKTTSKSIKDVVYPMYLPVDTYLESEKKLSSENGDRVILNFSGAKPFTIIQSNVSLDNVDYVNGDPYLINDTVGYINDNSLSWISNGTEFYVTSAAAEIDELLQVAQSLNLMSIGK